jgi:hypothetical protein
MRLPMIAENFGSVASGAGSSARTFARRIFDRCIPRYLNILSKGDVKQAKIVKFNQSENRIRFIDGSVSDQERLCRGHGATGYGVYAVSMGIVN